MSVHVCVYAEVYVYDYIHDYEYDHMYDHGYDCCQQYYHCAVLWPMIAHASSGGGPWRSS